MNVNVLGAWRTLTNWTQDGGAATRFPGEEDTVTIPGAKNGIRISLSEKVKTLKMETGITKLTSIEGFGALEILDGGYMKSGIVYVNSNSWKQSGGEFSWSNGEFRTTNAKTVEIKNGTFLITSSAAVIQPKLNVSWVPGTQDKGTVTIAGLDQDIGFENGIDVVAGTLNITQVNTKTIKRTGENTKTLTLSNSGLLQYDLGTTFNCELPLVNNAGRAYFKQGTFNFTTSNPASTYSIVQSGTAQMYVYDGATLNASSGTNVTGGVLMAYGNGIATLQGNLYFHGGSMVMTSGQPGWADWRIEGNMTMDGGSINITIDKDAGKFNSISFWTGGILTFGGTSSLVVNTLNGPFATGTTFDIIWATTITGDFASWTFQGQEYGHSIFDGGDINAYRLTAL